MRITSHIFFLLILQVSISGYVYGQEISPIQGFSPEDYKGLTQNWALSQSRNKYIYVANNIGLLEFNGLKWTVYYTPNSTAIRSVKVVDDKIYTGFYMNFGYWKKNEFGVLCYNSLSEKIKDEILEDEEFWGIEFQDDRVLFKSLNRLYIYNTKTEKIDILNIENGIRGFFDVNGTIYYHDAGKGIFKIEEGKSVLVNDFSQVNDDNIIYMTKQDEGVLVITSKHGFYDIKGKNIQKRAIAADSLLSKITLYSGIQLKNGEYALGTIANGFIHLSETGEIISVLNQNKGLNNNTVLTVFEDQDENVWLGLDKGLNCINITSPLKLFNDYEGEVGTVYTSVIFNEYLYLGTNQGLFYKKINVDESFSPVDGMEGQVWSLFAYDNTLFCGHHLGTFTIDKNKSTMISDIQGAWNFTPFPKDSTRLLQGHYKGLSILEKNKNTWKLKNKVSGFDISARFLQFFNNEIWINHEYKGVYKIQLNDDVSKVVRVHQDTILVKGINSNVISFSNKLLYGSNNGISSFNTKKKTFSAIENTSKLFTIKNDIKGKLLKDRNSGLWCFSKEYLGYIYPGKFSEELKIDKIPISATLRKEMPGFENITHIRDQKHLIGTTFGYLILDVAKLDYNEYDVLLHSVKIKNRTSEFRSVSLVKKPLNFSSQDNTISFSYTVPEYDTFVVSEFKYLLEGFHDNWSSWSTKPSVAFENLPPGNYTFRVRARTGDKISEKEIAFGFEINQPWYISNTALAIYAALLAIIMVLIHRSYKQYYASQRKKLLEENKKKLELKELENEKELMKLNNEKLKQDVENKNREIAASAMNIVKKNEILNAIKKELKNAQVEKRGFKSVERLIDKNLNNEEDWQHLEEAFNNLDKDFLKILKERHHDLTPNDLRFCTYLRLNLSSKEIAPLLNISVRSVEVKRYRLRKKLHLDHSDSLVSYILDI